MGKRISAMVKGWAWGAIAVSCSLIPTVAQAQIPEINLEVSPEVSPEANGEIDSETSSTDIPPAPLRVRTPCPADLDTLMQGLLRDLPSYTNRVHQRSSGPYREIQLPGSVLIASQPDFRPLTLNDWGSPQSTTPEPQNLEDPTLYQVFFTTLEGQQTDAEAQRLQRYHWVFLTRSSEADNDWRLAFMYSRIGDYPAVVSPATPPEETTYSAIGQGIRLWLRDCRAQAVDPVD
ncbi:MAG: hypothetical protein AAFW84_03945 [Cyanobacteria bacterium J06635_15]